MSLIPYKRSSLLGPFEELIDEIFNDRGSFFTPSSLKNTLKQKSLPRLNIYQKEDKLCIDAACPGIPKENINVEIENNILTISAKGQQQREVDDDDYYCREISQTSFSRSIQLPNEIKKEDIDNLSAKLIDGILKIEIPFKNEAKVSKKIININ